ncbi:BTAD domain-containing putative transcriptional regulator [Paractinoplanes atraurantiacus]|uniref:Predicted ATPase n=1 Tax=Paractinoplanes atraurantiacus TaxID=1036182 RepID=A0A285KBW1_9ACTN|nr:BTAD domain-containing putative transcriptional regulator [Actinoplanes atraurantiacus]SNY70058.1 Predicted ATPase [Actinoplanes atraurantiacus]
MRYGILGPVRAERDDGTPVRAGGARLRALLALLLLEAGRPVPVERLIDALWGGDPPAGALNAVQSNVSRLRQDLPIEYDGAGYRLAIDPDEVDAHRFERLATEGRQALTSGDPTRAAALLREALSLWRGETPIDVRGSAADRLVEMRRRAVEDRVDADPSPADEHELRALIGADPLRERSWALLMRVQALAGRDAEALSTYEKARTVLAEELGTDPSAELKAAHLRVLRGAPRRALPAQLTTFVGRQGELSDVGRALRRARLVTLLGPGGAGKTRLAVEAATRTTGEVHFVELAATTGPDVPRTVLDALGLRDTGLRARESVARPGAADRLVAALSTRDVLLVLDNCEHVVGAAAALVGRLLAGCAGVRVLATSREPLGLTGEVLCPVSGLAPDAAVRLFADRAGDVVAGFRAGPADRDAVERICRTLDGLPLAVELAAARLAVLPLDELARRVADRFAVLSRGSRTAAERHRTLRAVVAWSWDLLTGPERILARRLTVFRGGWTLEAAERVCGGTLDLLHDLVAKSLVERDGARYRMLETIRAFCAEQVIETDLGQAHAAYFLDLARTADAHLRGADQLTWLARLDADRDNLHAALRDGEPATALRLVAALTFYWWLRGSRGEAAALSTELLDKIGPEPPGGLREEYVLATLNAELAGARPPSGHSQRYLAALTAPPRQPFLLYLAAITAGPPPEATGRVTELHAELSKRLIGHPWSEALAAIGGGWMKMLFDPESDPAGAEAGFLGALGGFRELGDRWGMMLAQSGLAELAAWRGDHAAALAPMDAAMRLAGELGSVLDEAEVLRSRAEAHLLAGDLGAAAADFERSAERARACGAPELIAAARLGLGRIALLHGDHATARRLCESALRDCPAGWYTADGVRMTILVTLGRVAATAGDKAEAERWFRQVSTIAAGPDGLRAMADAQAGLDALGR